MEKIPRGKRLKQNRSAPYRPYRKPPSEANPDRVPPRTWSPLTEEEKGRVADEKALKVCRIRALRFARRYPFIDVEDFFQAAVIGYSDAVKSFDVSSGTAFSAYVDLRVDGECLNMMKTLPFIRVPIHVRREARRSGEPACTVYSMDAAPGAMSDDLLERAGVLPEPWGDLVADESFEFWIRGMDPADQFIVRMYYGPEEWAMHKIADHLGINTKSVCRRHAKILRHLRHRAGMSKYRDLVSA